MISPSTIAHIRDNADIAAIISETVSLNKHNQRSKALIGTCPFCHGTDALHVNAQRKFFHCFGCKESGSAIDWVMKTQHLGFQGAVTYLLARAALLTTTG